MEEYLKGLDRYEELMDLADQCRHDGDLESAVAFEKAAWKYV